MESTLLHGTLQVTIYNIEGLQTTLLQRLYQIILKGINYTTIDLDEVQVGRTTKNKKDQLNLGWNESFHIYCAHKASNIVFNVKNASFNGATLIGKAYIPVKDILDGDEIDRWVEILDEQRKPLSGVPKIHVKLQYFDVTKDPNWDLGIGSPKFSGVPHTYFSQKERCKVSLYQDSHISDHFAPEIVLDGGHNYQPQRCWEDMFDAINDAKYLIYITGWSVYTGISLVRDHSRTRSGGDRTLGELLKQKAEEGVTVLMLLWHDETSIPVINREGLMDTHGKETEEFFSGTRVQCVLCPRNSDDVGFLEKLGMPFMFTHHQKTVVVDSELQSESGKRGLISFVGGIDLCGGRYDTQMHSLFRTLDTNQDHSQDFHQPNFHGAEIAKGGPREPWHDIHARLEGSIAWDVLHNFEQRWIKQGKKEIPLRDINDVIIQPSEIPINDYYDNDNETWNVQLFRSIDNGSAYGLSKTQQDVSIADHSIQDAYINAIRRARKFIYIENQYFIGSSMAWNSNDKDMNFNKDECLNLIPKELSLKIVSKIKARERFSVYVVVPMWPEGEPESIQVRWILDRQRRTMEMMYKDIVEALNEKGIVDCDPRNYLTFFCLGNREVKMAGEYQPPKKPDQDSDYFRAQQARRFMIYVHSKMMIVDDEYIIIGSANINQRSMDGSRDTEIAIGAYQPHHLATIKDLPRAQIHGFRMSLWYEHLGILEESFNNPENEECIRTVNDLSNKYWDLYSTDSLPESDLPGHLLRYPVSICSDGTLTELMPFEFFPDTKARVLPELPYLPGLLRDEASELFCISVQKKLELENRSLLVLDE